MKRFDIRFLNSLQLDTEILDNFNYYQTIKKRKVNLSMLILFCFISLFRQSLKQYLKKMVHKICREEIFPKGN